MTTPDFARASALPRRLGLWSAVAVLVGSTIGSGIFRSPAGIADKLPGPLPFLSIWVIGRILALCRALIYAAVSGAFPRTLGVYVFIRVLGFDPVVAPYSNYVHYVAAGAILLLAAFNYVGMKWGSLVQNLTTLAKTGALLIIVILALALGLPETGGHFTPAAPAGSFTFASFGLALVSVLWVYDGWADVSFIGGEIKDPERNLPRVLIYGTLTIIGLYLLANIAYLAVLPVEEIRVSKLVAADAAEKLMGAVGVAFVSMAVMISTFGTLNGSVMTGARILFAMAADGLLFKPVATVHGNFPTHSVAIA